MPEYRSYSLRPSARAFVREEARPADDHQKLRNIEFDTGAGSARNASLAEVSAFCQATEPLSVIASYHMKSTAGLWARAYLMRSRMEVASVASPPSVSWLMNHPSKP
jgi:hypothetical protein